MDIATGLLLKQNLFEGVLNESSLTDEVDFSEKGKSQFVKRLEEIVAEDHFMPEEQTINEDDTLMDTLVEDDTPLQEVAEKTTEPKPTSKPKEKSENRGENKEEEAADFKQMEEVMTKGMEFLTGLYQMSTGKSLGNNSTPKVKVNKETGEVSISFKMK